MTQAQTAFFTAASLGLKNDKKRVLNDVIRGIKETVDTNSGNIDSNDTTIAAITGTLNKYADAFSVSGSTITFSGLVIADTIDVQTLNAANLQFEGNQTISGDFDITGQAIINERLLIGTSGTSTPEAQLHVLGADANNVFNNSKDIVVLSAGGNQQFKFFVDETNKKAALQSVEAGVGSKDLLLQPSGGNVGIGTASPSQILHVYDDNPQVQVQHDVGSAGSAGFRSRASGANSSANASYYEMNGGSMWGQTGGLGIRFGPIDRSVVEMLINTNSHRVGIGTQSPAVKCDVVGRVRASNGILFGSDTVAANTLDDYEEGTWTPAFAFATLGTTNIVYNNDGTSGTFGRYTKIGNVVYVSGQIVTSTFTFSGANGAARLYGLPFFPSNNSEGYGLSLLTYGGITGSPGDVIHLRSRTASFFVFKRSQFGSSTVADLAVSNFTSGTNLNLKFSGFYMIG